MSPGLLTIRWANRPFNLDRRSGAQGIGGHPYNGWRIIEHGPAVVQKWFAPIRLGNGDQTIQLVAVWLNDGADYVIPTIAAWETLRPYVESGPTILAGDFNQSVVFDKGKGQGRRFGDVLRLLGDAGLASAWHDSTDEKHGEESQATLHWRWQEASRFHIDYVFYPPQALSVTSARLGTYPQYVAEKISDHVPLIVDLEFK
jgi:hypothetical protein